MQSYLKESRFAGGKLGPGPAAYTLKTTVGNEKQFTFGVKPAHIYLTHSASPGPAYGPKMDFPCQNSFGNATSLKYSLGNRNPHISPDKKMPGPADCQTDPAKHKPEDYQRMVRSIYHASPKYSLSSRYPMIEDNRGPGPATYNPDPKLVGTSSPHYSLYSRATTKSTIYSPGPAVYNLRDAVRDPIRDKAPEYSFRDRTKIIDKRVSPGPAAYSLMHVKTITGQDRSTAVDFKKGPSWSLRKRTNHNPMIVEQDFC